MIKVFISHSSRDKDIAEKLTDLLKGAFRFRSSEILCTSVSGHKLPAGSDTEEELRTKVQNAGVLIGIITPASAESSFVLFELGARWGFNRPLIPLLAAGFVPNDLREPLKSKNSLLGYDQNDVYQLVDDISKILNLIHEPASAYSKHVAALSKACKSVAKKTERKSEIEKGLQVSIGGIVINNGSILHLDNWSFDLVKIGFDFQNISKQPIKKGTTHVYIETRDAESVELLVGNDGMTLALESMQTAKGHIIYSLPTFPTLLPGSWKSWTVGFWGLSREYKARRIMNFLLNITDPTGQRKIRFKIKLLPRRKIS